MKRFVPILPLLGMVVLCSFTFQNDIIKDYTEDTDTTKYYIDLGSKNDAYFDAAYDEIVRMIDGRDSISVKRAVFLIEWAYLEGKPDYKKFCADIDTTVMKLKYFIKINDLNKYRTAGNFALFEYFTKPSPLNGDKAFKYDFEDFLGEKDYRQIFVSKVMETHTGQCTSLPLYYKILSDELGAESFLALAPHHMYIKHIDEYDRWVNIELTNGHFSTDAYMISSMAISAEAIKNKVYLDALSEKESIALLLVNLSSAYKRKYGYDNFVMKCANKSLSVFPHYLGAMFTKHNVLVEIGQRYIEKFGHKQSPFMDANYKAYKDLNKIIENLGYREMTQDNYLKWVKVMEDEGENLLTNGMVR